MPIGLSKYYGPCFPLEPKAVEEEESSFSSPLMLWLQQEQKRKENITEKKPKKGLVFEISSDDGFQICAESIEGEWLELSLLQSGPCCSCFSAQEAFLLLMRQLALLRSVQGCRLYALTYLAELLSPALLPLPQVHSHSVPCSLQLTPCSAAPLPSVLPHMRPQCPFPSPLVTASSAFSVSCSRKPCMQMLWSCLTHLALSSSVKAGILLSCSLLACYMFISCWRTSEGLPRPRL